MGMPSVYINTLETECNQIENMKNKISIFHSSYSWTSEIKFNICIALHKGNVNIYVVKCKYG